MFKIYLEEIYGNNAIVYHRTRVSDLINRVYTSGFRPGSGDMYGKGFYSTYSIESQKKPEMRTYGDLIVKFQVSLNNFFFFDWSEFKKSPLFKQLSTSKKVSDINASNFIQTQLDYYKIKFSYKQKPVPYSSHIALNMWRTLKDNGIDGIIFTGEHDGQVLVCYEINRVIPTSYSEDDGKTFIKVTPQNLEYIQKAFELKQNRMFNSKKQKEMTDEEIEDYWDRLAYEYDDEYISLLKHYCDEKDVLPNAFKEFVLHRHSLSIIVNGTPMNFYIMNDMDSLLEEKVSHMAENVFDDEIIDIIDQAENELQFYLDKDAISHFIEKNSSAEKKQELYDKASLKEPCDYCLGTGKDKVKNKDLFGNRASCPKCNGHKTIKMSFNNFEDIFDNLLDEDRETKAKILIELFADNPEKLEDFIDDYKVRNSLYELYSDMSARDLLGDNFIDLSPDGWAEII